MLCRNWILRLQPKQFIRSLTVQSSAKSQQHLYDDHHQQYAWQLTDYSDDLRSLTLKHCVDDERRHINGAHQVLVHVKAASINPIDLEIASGFGRSAFNCLRFAKSCGQQWDQYPLCLGRDFSGVIQSVGPAVTRFKIGDEVIGVLSPEVTDGSHATHVVADSNLITFKPPNMSHTQAASIPYAGLTALSAISIYSGLNESNARFKRVLILGGTGSVGISAIAILKSFGADVTATCASNAVDWLKSVSPVDDVIDYENGAAFESHVGKYDLVLNTASMSSGALHTDALNCLKKNSGSQYVSLTHPLLRNMDQQGLLLGLINSTCEILFQNVKQYTSDGICIKWAFVMPSSAGLELLADLTMRGNYEPILDRVFTFDQTREAYEFVAKGHARGKTVIQIASPDDVE